MKKGKSSKVQRKKLRRERRKWAGEDGAGRSSKRRSVLTDGDIFPSNKEWSIYAKELFWSDYEDDTEYLSLLDHCTGRKGGDYAATESDPFIEWHSKIKDLNDEIRNIIRESECLKENGLLKNTDASKREWYTYGLLCPAKVTLTITELTPMENKTTQAVKDSMFGEDENSLASDESLITITTSVDDNSLVDLGSVEATPPPLEDSWESLSSDKTTISFEDDSSSFGEITEVGSVISLLSFSLPYEVSYANALMMGIGISGR